MLSSLHVLLVEDDRRLAALVAEFFENRGVQVSVAHDGVEGLRLASEHGVDCVLLDIMLPGLDGLAVCRQLRLRSDVPVIMLTALDSEGERVVGLENGSDDYITKPFSTPELLARVRAQARRYRGELRHNRARVSVGELTVDRGSRIAILKGTQIELTGYEFDLLLVFAENAGRVLSRERLLSLTHGDPGMAFDRSIDGHVSRLRVKLGDNPRAPRYLQTVRGAGYRLNPTPAEPED